MYSCSWWPTRYSPSMTRLASRERRGDVARLDLVVGEDALAQERVEDRRQRLGPNRYVGDGLVQEGAIRSRDQGDRLGVMANLRVDQDRLVVLDRVDDVRAGDVGGGDDDHLRPVEAGVALDPEEAGVGLGRADRRAVPRPGEDQVVGVLGRAGQLGRTLATERPAAGCAARGRRFRPKNHGGRSAARRGPDGHVSPFILTPHDGTRGAGLSTVAWAGGPGPATLDPATKPSPGLDAPTRCSGISVGVVVWNESSSLSSRWRWRARNPRSCRPHPGYARPPIGAIPSLVLRGLVSREHRRAGPGQPLGASGGVM